MTTADRPRLSLTGNPAELIAVAHRITSRDIAIADWLDQHGVFTTGQLAQAFFTSPITCSHRLAALRRLGWVDRFRRYLAGVGPGPACWVLGPLGARWCAAAAETPTPTPAQLRRLRDRYAASPQLGHRLGAHQLFVDLHAHGVLDFWWSAAETAARFAARVRPDGAGRAAGLPFWLEHDTGTMPLSRLVAKLDAYSALRADGGPGWPVLFHLPGRVREQHLHDALARVRLVVSVATAVHADPPYGPVWRLAGGGAQTRLRLGQLPWQPATGAMWTGELV